MKTRLGFVSNSSSSSFIVKAQLEEGQDKITVSLPLEFFGDDIISTEKGLENFYKEAYCYGKGSFQEQLEMEERWEEYQENLEYIQQGGVIMEKSCEYGEVDSFEDLVRAAGLKIKERW